jgi:hypothetical protein
MLLSLAKSLRQSHGGSGLLMVRWRLHLTVRPRVEHMRTRVAKLSRDLQVDKSGSSFRTARVGICPGASMRNCSSLHGKLVVQSTSMMMGGRDRQQDTNLSRMYVDQNTRRCSSCCQGASLELGSSFSLRL